MELIVDGDHRGTSEQAWRTWGGLAALPPLSLALPEAVVVVAPHPDDEVLGAGGFIQLVLTGGVPLEIVAVTDGEGSHPLATTLTPADLRSIRGDESRRALGRLGWKTPHVTRLQIPDGQVAGQKEVLAEALYSRLGANTLCVSPWSRDGHPDHDVCGHVAAEACSARGARSLHYLVWAWHWASPRRPDIPWEMAGRLDLGKRQVARKRWATRAFISQTRPVGPRPGDAAILPSYIVRRFQRNFEVYLTGMVMCPNTDRSYFENIYAEESDPWHFATSWYEQRKYALTMAALPLARYGSAFEPGCSIGILTELLASRCDQLLATEIVPSALDQARQRLALAPHVAIVATAIPEDWPDQQFDLVVLSEIAYYFDIDSLSAVTDLMVGSLTLGGTVVGVHWSGPSDYPLTGQSAHAVIDSHRGLRRLLTHTDQQFVLDVWERT